MPRRARSGPSTGDPSADPGGPDGGFEVTDGSTLDAAGTAWEGEIARARTDGAGRVLDQPGPFMGAEVPLRRIYSPMPAEYARHAGHADLIRERIDGVTGV